MPTAQARLRRGSGGRSHRGVKDMPITVPAGKFVKGLLGSLMISIIPSKVETSGNWLGERGVETKKFPEWKNTGVLWKDGT